MIESESRLQRALARILPQTVHGTYSRCVEFRHLAGASVPSRAGPLWGMGSRMHGGRFTPKGAFETIYLAEDPITALAEVALVLLGPRGSLLGGRNPPWVLVSVEGLLLRVLDLTDPATREAIGTNLQELTGAWLPVQAEGNEAPTQVLGRVCHQTGRFDGIPYPSGKNPLLGVCLAVFPDRLREPASLRVYDPYGRLAQKLP